MAGDKTVLSEEERLAILSSVKALNSLSGNAASVVNANKKAADKISAAFFIEEFLFSESEKILPESFLALPKRF